MAERRYDFTPAAVKPLRRPILFIDGPSFDDECAAERAAERLAERRPLTPLRTVAWSMRRICRRWMRKYPANALPIYETEAKEARKAAGRETHRGKKKGGGARATSKEDRKSRTKAARKAGASPHGGRMTAPPDLRGEVLRVLGAESPARPLRLESLREVLVCARGIYPEAGQLEAAIHVLMDAGSIEVVHHVRLGARYRLQRHRRGVDMSEPEPPRAA